MTVSRVSSSKCRRGVMDLLKVLLTTSVCQCLNALLTLSNNTHLLSIRLRSTLLSRRGPWVFFATHAHRLGSFCLTAKLYDFPHRKSTGIEARVAEFDARDGLAS